MPRMRGFITINNCIPYSKNPKIAKIFREIGLADELGSGVRNITNYSEIYSGTKPVFEDGSMFKATVFLKAQDNLISEIIEFCKDEKNIFEIMEKVGYKNRTRFRRDYIKPLVEEGLLKMTVPDKPTSKKQKYIATK